MKERKLYRVVYRIQDKRKREKWLWEQGNGVFEGDEVVALEGCIFDITPIVRTQERTNSAIYLAEDKERRRIAGEIHDGLQQTLSVSALNLQYLESELDLLSEECRQRYQKSREYLEKVANAITKVKALLNYQDKNEEKIQGGEARKTAASEKERIKKEIEKKRKLAAKI